MFEDLTWSEKYCELPSALLEWRAPLRRLRSSKQILSNFAEATQSHELAKWSATVAFTPNPAGLEAGGSRDAGSKKRGKATSEMEVAPGETKAMRGDANKSKTDAPKPPGGGILNFARKLAPPEQPAPKPSSRTKTKRPESAGDPSLFPSRWLPPYLPTTAHPHSLPTTSSTTTTTIAAATTTTNNGKR